MITIINIKTTTDMFRHPDYVYVGSGSKFGNPFVVGRDGGPGKVNQKYREWILTQSRLLKELSELKDKILGCDCGKSVCHAQILKWLVEEVIDNIPQGCYCYTGGRNGNRCKFWESRPNGDAYCSLIKKHSEKYSTYSLIWDQCKECKIHYHFWDEDEDEPVPQI